MVMKWLARVVLVLVFALGVFQVMAGLTRFGYFNFAGQYFEVLYLCIYVLMAAVFGLFAKRGYGVGRWFRNFAFAGLAICFLLTGLAEHDVFEVRDRTRHQFWAAMMMTILALFGFSCGYLATSERKEKPPPYRFEVSEDEVW